MLDYIMRVRPRMRGCILKMCVNGLLLEYARICYGGVLFEMYGVSVCWNLLVQLRVRDMWRDFMRFYHAVQYRRCSD